jgi:hypothetical protein
MRAWNCLALSLALAACAESSKPCEPEGRSFDAAEGRFCLYSSDSPLVIEGGFACPAQLPFRFDTDAGVACAERDLERLPQSVCEQLGAECEDGAEPREPSAEPSSGVSGRPRAATPEDSWRAVAEERGFLRALDGADFFETMQFGCIVDTTERPATWQELARATDRVVLASIAEVVVEPEQPPPSSAAADEGVYLRIDVEQVAKGDTEATLLVRDDCGSGGKVFPLRERLPAESLVFLLNEPTVSTDGQPEAAGLAYYYLGIVREDETGLRFALSDGGSSPSLSEFDSLQGLIDAVSSLDP